MIDVFKISSYYNDNRITIARFFSSCNMIFYKNIQLETTNTILHYILLSAMIIMVADGSQEKKSVLNKCQTMEDCPAGEICEKYEDMEYSLDYMVEAEILLG